VKHTTLVKQNEVFRGTVILTTDQEKPLLLTLVTRMH